MDPRMYDRLSAGFVTAINRHQNMVRLFGSECPKLLDRLCQIAGNFKTTQGSVFAAQREKKPYQCLVIRSRWFSNDHPLGVRVLTLEPGDLMYHPGHQLLCGPIQVVLSNGDYIRALQQAKVGAVSQALSVFSNTAASAASNKQSRAMSAFAGIDRFQVDEFYLFLDEPGVWKRPEGESGELRALDVEAYMCTLLDWAFNPEGKGETF